MKYMNQFLRELQMKARKKKNMKDKLRSEYCRKCYLINDNYDCLKCGVVLFDKLKKELDAFSKNKSLF